MMWQGGRVQGSPIVKHTPSATAVAQTLAQERREEEEEPHRQQPQANKQCSTDNSQPHRHKSFMERPVGQAARPAPNRSRQGREQGGKGRDTKGLRPNRRPLQEERKKKGGQEAPASKTAHTRYATPPPQARPTPAATTGRKASHGVAFGMCPATHSTLLRILHSSCQPARDPAHQQPPTSAKQAQGQGTAHAAAAAAAQQAA